MVTVLEEEEQINSNKTDKQEKRNTLCDYWGKAAENDNGALIKMTELPPEDGVRLV